MVTISSDLISYCSEKLAFETFHDPALEDFLAYWAELFKELWVVQEVSKVLEDTVVKVSEYGVVYPLLSDHGKDFFTDKSTHFRFNLRDEISVENLQVETIYPLAVVLVVTFELDTW